MNVAVVGAGIMGSSAARFVAADGHEVTIFEQYPLGHARGSSHGSSRIIRKAYPDPFYTGLLLEGFPLWMDLEAEAGQTLLNWTGLAYIGRADDPEIEGGQRTLAELGVPFDAVSSVPGLRLDAGEVATLVPEAGWVNADLALSVTQRLAFENGAHLVEKRIGSLTELRDYERVVIAAGAYARELVPDAPFHPTKQTVCYVRGQYDGPVWIEAGSHMYGFPNEPGADAFKVAEHKPGPQATPGEPFDPVPEQVAAVEEACRRRLGIAKPEVVETVTCLYTYRIGEDFVIDWLDERTLFLSPCSGHGFKFAPWVGKLAADLIAARRDLSGLERLAMPSV